MLNQINELLPVRPADIGGTAIQAVDGRKLHEFLGVGTAFKDWISRSIEDFGFIEGKDFCSFLSESQGGRPAKEYALSLPMAKELSMVQRTAKGKEARLYFLECERQLAQATQRDPMELLNDPSVLRNVLLGYTEKVLALESKVQALEPKAIALDRIVTHAEGSLCLSNAAKALQMRPKSFIEWLSANRWIFKRAGGRNWTGYQERLQSLLLEHKCTTVLRPDGTEKICDQVLVTAKGMAKLAQLLGVTALEAV